MARPKSSDPRQVVTLRLSAAELAAVELAAAAAELERSEYLRRSALDGGRAGGLDRPQRESTEGYRGPPDDIVRTPQGREPVTYELREASALITSHVPGTWSPDPRYPRAVQERDYQHDANEQAKRCTGSRARSTQSTR